MTRASSPSVISASNQRSPFRHRSLVCKFGNGVHGTAGRIVNLCDDHATFSLCIPLFKNHFLQTHHWELKNQYINIYTSIYHSVCPYMFTHADAPLAAAIAGWAMRPGSRPSPALAGAASPPPPDAAPGRAPSAPPPRVQGRFCWSRWSRWRCAQSFCWSRRSRWRCAQIGRVLSWPLYFAECQVLEETLARAYPWWLVRHRCASRTSRRLDASASSLLRPLSINGFGATCTKQRPTRGTTVQQRPGHTPLNRLAGQRGTPGCQAMRAAPRACSCPTPPCRSNRLHSPHEGSSAFRQGIGKDAGRKLRSHCALQ